MHNDLIGVDRRGSIQINEGLVVGLLRQILDERGCGLSWTILSIVEHVDVLGVLAFAPQEHLKIVAKIVARREGLQTELHELPALGDRLRVGIFVELLDDETVDFVAEISVC